MVWNLNTYQYTKLSGITNVRTQELASKTEYFTYGPQKAEFHLAFFPECQSADWGWCGAPRYWRCYCLAQGGPEVQCHWRQIPVGFYIPGAGGTKKAGHWQAQLAMTVGWHVELLQAFFQVSDNINEFIPHLMRADLLVSEARHR